MTTEARRWAWMGTSGLGDMFRSQPHLRSGDTLGSSGAGLPVALRWGNHGGRAWTCLAREGARASRLPVRLPQGLTCAVLHIGCVWLGV